MEAEDIAQEALIHAWRNRSKLRDPDRWADWLTQIARRQALRTLERKLPLPAEVPDTLGEEDSTLTGLVEAAEVAAALASLSASDREILRLRYVEDLTQPQVADRLEIGESAAKVRLNRARKRLAKSLSADI